MNSYICHQCKVVKVFNNNVLLVNENDIEKILFRKGIGFGKKTGDIINSGEKVEKIFTIEDKTNYDNFKQLINYADKEIIALSEEVIVMISNELSEELDEKIHISLTDHILFALKRLEGNEEIENPFLSETEILYKTEFDIAKKATIIIEKATKIKIPDGEVGFIALHIHSARNNGKLSNTIKYNFVCNSVVEFLEEEMDIKIDKRSLDYARFVTHIRFAIERFLNNKPIKNELISAIKKQYKSSYKIARKSAKIIEEQLYIDITEDEIAYLAMHIERLKQSSCNGCN
ncbi:glucose PTS transporter transcription antiterminator GlcT [Clostridium algidicarnis]|uniref:glucose PTS transporter transcription antiterminator GlcT n=1 Tax=Clostridium algidicarnis TaxID=37659 RepID=UPI00049656C0|nr:PRD domain-containing protein [Clostridium algidicarnis]